MLGQPKTQFVALLLCGALLNSPAAREQSSKAPAPGPVTARSKEIAKRARTAFSQAQQAEKNEDWQAAFALYSEAAELLPGNGEYLMKRETARFRLVREHVDRAERAAVAGRLEEARAELRAALALDPSYTVAQERLQQFEPRLTQRVEQTSYPSRPAEVMPLPGARSFDFRGDTRAAYAEVARQFGLTAAFDEDLRPQQVRFRVEDVNFPTAMHLLGRQTGTFWRAVDEHTFLVAPDNPQKRRELEPSVVRTVTLSNLATPEQMTEMVRLVREIAGVRRTQLDMRARTLTMRDSPESVDLAVKIIENLEQPVGEMMLEIEILDVNRNAAQRLGITPPTSARTFTVSPEDIRQAQQSPAALLQVLQRVFGTPTTFTGQSSLGALIPPLVAFGGGKSIFLATLPGAAADFADIFSTLRQAQRLLLRAQDGQPVTFFSGERFPVAVAVLQPNLVSPLAAAVEQASFPRSGLNTPEGPRSIVAADFNGDGRMDLAVANATLVTIASGGAVRSANLVTITTTSAHGLSAGQTVVIAGVSDSSFNGAFMISAVPSATTFTYTQTGPDATSGGGTVSTLATIASSNGAVRSANLVTITTTSAHGLSAGQTVTVNGVSDSSFNGTFVISAVPSATTFTYAETGSDASSGGGNVFTAANSVSIFLGNGDGTFGARSDIPLGISPISIAVADFNADGHPDLAVANEGSNSVSILLGNGDGTFTQKADIATGTAPSAVIAGDFNGDGRVDLAVAHSGSNTIASNGAVRSANTVTITTTSAHGLSVGQSVTISGVSDSSFNGTFVVATVRSATTFTYAQTSSDGANGGGTATSNTVSIFLGDGHGAFGQRIDLAAGANPRALVTGRFNADAFLDLAVVNQDANTVSVFLGNGDGTFGPRTDYATGNAPLGIAAADFNGDNQLDLAVVNRDSNSVSILLGNGDGSFRARTDFAVGDSPAAVVTGDFNADGHTDLITANSKANAVTVLLGTGDGSFGLRADLNTGSGPAALTAADFNGDGRIDLAVANHDDNTVSVILNQTPIVPPSAISTSLAATPYPGFQYEDLGVKVRATPRLHSNGEVTLQLQFEIRSLAGQAINQIPILSNRTVEETVRLRENETTLLTGILERTEQLAITGWPGFAGTPGVGPLASSRNPQRQETELLIFITPRRIRLAPRLGRSIYAGFGGEGEKSGAAAQPPP